jgi:hypothetical protein
VYFSYAFELRIWGLSGNTLDLVEGLLVFGGNTLWGLNRDIEILTIKTTIFGY